MKKTFCALLFVFLTAAAVFADRCFIFSPVSEAARTRERISFFKQNVYFIKKNVVFA